MPAVSPEAKERKRTYDAAWRASHREELKTYNKTYRQENATLLNAARRVRRRSWSREQRARQAAHNRAWRKRVKQRARAELNAMLDALERQWVAVKASQTEDVTYGPRKDNQSWNGKGASRKHQADYYGRQATVSTASASGVGRQRSAAGSD